MITQFHVALIVADLCICAFAHGRPHTHFYPNANELTLCPVTNKDIPLKHASSVVASQLVRMHNTQNDALLQWVQLNEWVFHLS